MLQKYNLITAFNSPETTDTPETNGGGKESQTQKLSFPALQVQVAKAEGLNFLGENDGEKLARLSKLENLANLINGDLEDNGDGSSAESIARLQEYLKGKGWYQGEVDGLWGSQTSEAVKQFQEEYNKTADEGEKLTVDGLFGVNTSNAFINYIESEAEVETQPDPEIDASNPVDTTQDNDTGEGDEAEAENSADGDGTNSEGEEGANTIEKPPQTPEIPKLPDYLTFTEYNDNLMLSFDFRKITGNGKEEIAKMKDVNENHKKYGIVAKPYLLRL